MSSPGGRKMRDNERLPLVLPAVWTKLQTGSATNWKRCSAMRRISSLPCSPACCTCCRRAAPSAPIGRLWRSPRTWLQEGLLTPAEGTAAAGRHRPRARRSAPASRRRFPPALALAQVASMGVASGAVALDPEAVKRFASRRRTGHSGAAGDGYRGYRWHGAGGRHSHRLGRPHIACGRGRAAAWQGLSGGLSRAGNRSGSAPNAASAGHCLQRGRFPVAGWQYRSGLRRTAGTCGRAAGSGARDHCRVATCGGVSSDGFAESKRLKCRGALRASQFVR